MVTRTDIVRPGLFSRAVAADGRRLEFDYQNEAVVHNRVPVDFVFIGDSITQMWELQAYFGGRRRVVLNRGIGGDITEYVLKRFEADVLQLRPAWAVLLIGANDAFGTLGDPVYGHAGMTPADVIEQIVTNITAVVTLAKTRGQHLALCSILPTHAGLYGIGDSTNEIIVAANARLRNLADGKAVVYVDYHAALVDEDGRTLRAGYSYEGLHPHVAGYNVMAATLRATLARHGVEI